MPIPHHPGYPTTCTTTRTPTGHAMHGAVGAVVNVSFDEISAHGVLPFLGVSVISGITRHAGLTGGVTVVVQVPSQRGENHCFREIPLF